MAYATLAHLADWLMIPQDQLNANSSRYLWRASELIDYVTFGKIDPDNEEQMEYVISAVCCQVEYWLTVGELDTQSPVSSYNIGNFSVNYASGTDGGAKALSPRARRFLVLSGLLYRGVGMRP